MSNTVRCTSLSTGRMSLEKATTLTFLTFSIVLLGTDMAYATGAMESVLCSIVYMVYGNIGRALATLGVAVVGIGACLGKVTWGLALTVAVGVAIIFNAGTIAGLLGVGTCP